MINYFDLGLLHGDEIQIFIDAVGDKPYRVYGFEPNPIYYKKCVKRFKNNINVMIFNIAISDSYDTIKLYLEPSGEGSSIFSDKNNVTKDFVEVRCINFAPWAYKWIQDGDTNLLRFNIEGAELKLIQTLIDYKIHDKFMYLGAEAGADLLKVESLKVKHPEYMELLKKHNINILPFCSVYNRKSIPINNVDLRKLLNN